MISGEEGFPRKTDHFQRAYCLLFASASMEGIYEPQMTGVAWYCVHLPMPGNVKEDCNILVKARLNSSTSSLCNVFGLQVAHL